MKNELFFGQIILLLVLLTGCYSFKGGSVPPHLSTLNIMTVKDNSTSQNPENRLVLTDYLTDEFKDDGSLKVVNNNADARLETTITSTTEESAEVGSRELETRRKVVVTCNVIYYDNVKQKEIFNKNFEHYGYFEVAQAAQQRDEAIKDALEKISEDIVFNVVSDW